MSQQVDVKGKEAREPLSAASTNTARDQQIARVREYKFIHWVPPDPQPSRPTTDSTPRLAGTPGPLKKPLAPKPANSVQRASLPHKSTSKAKPPPPAGVAPSSQAPVPAGSLAIQAAPSARSPPCVDSAPEPPASAPPSSTVEAAASPITYHPFPMFGRSYLEQVLRWWWYPLEANSVPAPLREWTDEQRRASGGQWKQAELVIRGWYIMKGHELLPNAADQAQALELDELETDVREWKLRWSESVEVGRNKIREYLRNHDPPYEWAPAKRSRWTAEKPRGSIPAKRDRSSLWERETGEAALEALRKEEARQEEAKKDPWYELKTMPGLDFW